MSSIEVGYPHLPTAVFLLLGAILAYAVYTFNRSNANRRYPPGPKGIPVLGNLFQMSLTTWNEFAKWKQEYGPIVYVTVAGQGMLILNTHKTAADLLDRRGTLYGDRPTWIVAGEFLTRGLLVAIAKQGETWLKLRRAAHEALSKVACSKFYPVIQKEAVTLTQNLLQDSTRYRDEFRRQSASIILSILYDLPPITSYDHPLVRKINEFLNLLVYMMFPGTHLVEFFPWLKHFPSAISPWKRRAEEGFVSASCLFEGLFRDVKSRTEDGDMRPSIVGGLICNKEKIGLSDLEASWLGGTIYAGAGDTTAAVMTWFLLAMIAYPEKQKKCQEELDAIVGRSRMPTFEDRDHLPYLRATVREALRWRPIIPIGVHHYTTEDDWYDGYFIPKGTICFANVWSMNRDPEVYGSDADDFNPDRFIDQTGNLSPAIADTKDEGHVSYGYGPRICLGRHLANNTLFINIACLLWAGKISPIIDQQTGKPIIPNTLQCKVNGMVVPPLPFDCKIEPRFSEAEGIVTQTMELNA